MVVYSQLSGYNDVVFSVVWNLQADETIDDVTYSASKEGVVYVNLESFFDNFTPYSSLTKDFVLNEWVIPSLNVPELTAELAANILEQQGPKVQVLSPPW